MSNEQSKPYLVPPSAGPWEAGDDRVYAGCGDGEVCKIVCYTATNKSRRSAEARANAKLISYSPDYALLLLAITSGKATWERWAASRTDVTGCVGEVCVGGMRFATTADEFGLPVVTTVMRPMLLQVLSVRPGLIVGSYNSKGK